MNRGGSPQPEPERSHEGSMIRVGVALLGIVCLAGCASITIHNEGPMSDVVARDPRMNSPTPLYGGVSSDFIEIGRGLSAPVRCWRNPKVKWYDICIVPFAIVDTPLSLVVDTLYLPSDVMYWPTWTAEKKREETQEANANNPVHATGTPAPDR